MRTQIIDKSVVISAIEGKVEIVLADGSSRPLQKGEILQPGAKVTIADDAKLVLSPYDDTPASGATAGSESAASAQPQGGSPTEGAPSDIAALQQSILQGADPTQNFEATAAGGAPAAGGGDIGGVAGASGNGGFVTIDRTGDATIAEAGFDTTYDTGVVINENQAEDIILENQLDDLGEAVVTLEDAQVSGNLLENSTNPDGPADASIVSYDWGINIGVPAGVAATITGVGTLIINPDGSYTFTPAPNYDGAVPPVNYQVTDGQNTVTSTFVVSITPVDEEVDLAGLDREGGEVQVSDTNLADGSAPNAAVLTQSGVFIFNAPDGVQSLTLAGVTLITNGQLGASFPQSIISPLGNALTITAVTYNPVTGGGQVSYSYILGDNGDHTRPANDTSLSESFSVVLIDSDGDTASDTLDVTILDDIPTLADGEELSVRSLVHEDALTSGNSEGTGQSASASGAAGTLNSLVNFGADGAGSFGLGSDVSSLVGLGLTSGGVALSYSVVGNVLIASAGGVPVFTLTVGADGSYSFTLSGPLDHPTADGDDGEQLAGVGIDFSGVLTATDGDGDPLTGSFPVGSFAIKVEDDVPSVTINAVADSDITLTTQDAQTIGAASDTASASFAAAFLAAAVPGYGADGAGTTTVSGYSLSVTDSSSGLTSNGLAITLSKVGSDIVGSTTAGEVFCISVASNGTVTLTQSAELDHLPEDVDDSNDNNLISLASGKVLLSATVTVVDGDNDTATGTVSADLGGNIRFEDDVPSVTISANSAAVAGLDESGASGTATLDTGAVVKGNDPDVSGAGYISKASSNGAVVTLTTEAYGADGAAVAGSKVYNLVVSNPTSGLTLTDGSAITLVQLGNGVVVGQVVGGAFAGQAAFAIQIDSATGVMTVEQYLSLAHPAQAVVGNSYNSYDETIALAANSLGVTVTLKDGDNDTVKSATADISGQVRFDDDGPSASAVTNSGQATQVQNTNLMLILDISGSMEEASGYQGMTRMQVMQKSALELLDKYSAYGTVMVNIITFASSATNPTSVWVNVDVAKSTILGLQPSGGTNYDDALNEAIKAFGDTGRQTNAQNVSYFMSDGQPTANALSGSAASVPDGNNALGGGNGIDGDGSTLSGETKDWADFLTANNINSFALGMGSGSTQSALDPIAYNGVSGASPANTTAVVVTDFSQLAATLLSTVVAPPLAGQMINGIVASVGADGGWLSSITVGGVTYTYNQNTDTSGVSGGTSVGTFNQSTNEWTIALAGGTLKVDMDNGAYTYTPPSSIPAGGINQVVGYGITDKDGDTASSTLAIVIKPAVGPTVVRDDFIITNQDPATVPDWALLVNDTGPLAATQIITGVSGAVGGTVTDNAGSVTFDDTSGSATPSSYEGSFNYTNSSTTDTAKVFVDVQSGATLTGSYLDEILIGGTGADTLNGNAGNDILLGGAGNDSLNGDEGNDILVGGAGNDTLNGGAGNDTASYIDSTAGVTVTVNGNNQATGGAGTDSLSNMENLVGSMFNDSLTGDSNANVLSGLAGSDILSGGGGDDLLLGGADGDTLTGGGGKDTFKWGAGDIGGVDVIKDFTIGAGGDVLDFSELLVGEHANKTSLDAYLTFATGPGTGKSTLTIDLDGSGVGTTAHIIQFDNIDLTAGGTRNDQTIIEDLLNQGNLKVDP